MQLITRNNITVRPRKNTNSSMKSIMAKAAEHKKRATEAALVRVKKAYLAFLVVFFFSGSGVSSLSGVS